LISVNIIGIITARGGSRGIPRKNIKDLNGKPLIAYTIEVGKKSRHLNRVIVSTDDVEIADVAKTWGAEVPCMRPEEFARDNTPTLPVIQHMTRHIEETEKVDIVVTLQPTSPLRTAEDIDGAVQKLIDTNADTVVSVVEVKHHPYLTFKLDGDKLEPLYCMEKRLRRQELPTIYALNGAVYVTRRDTLLNRNSIYGDDNRGYVMPEERSMDIDSLFHFKLVEAIMMMGDSSR
jgi:CMP-N-acetylneuraminic acid synthetase